MAAARIPGARSGAARSRSNSWTAIGQNSRAIAAANSLVYIISSVDDTVWEIIPSTNPAGAIRLSSAPAKSLAVDQQTLYKVAPDNSIWKYTGTPDQWTRLPAL